MTLDEKLEIAAGPFAFRIMRCRSAEGLYSISLSINGNLIGVVHGGVLSSAEFLADAMLDRWLDVQNRRAQLRVVKE